MKLQKGRSGNCQFPTDICTHGSVCTLDMKELTLLSWPDNWKLPRFVMNELDRDLIIDLAAYEPRGKFETLSDRLALSTMYINTRCNQKQRKNQSGSNYL